MDYKVKIERNSGLIHQHISFYSLVSGNAIFSCSIFLQVADAWVLLNAKDIKMFS